MGKLTASGNTGISIYCTCQKVRKRSFAKLRSHSSCTKWIQQV